MICLFQTHFEIFIFNKNKITTIKVTSSKQWCKIWHLKVFMSGKTTTFAYFIYFPFSFTFTGWTTPFWTSGPFSCSKRAGHTTKSTTFPDLVKSLNMCWSTVFDDPKSKLIGGSWICIIQQSSTHLSTNGSQQFTTISYGSIKSGSSLKDWKRNTVEL